jgi:hypothetical protein
MPCTVTDKIGYRSSAGVHTTIANLQVYAVPSSTAQTFDYAGTWRPNAARNPMIVGAPSLDHGEVATTDATGTFTLVMPYATETHPLSPEAQWTIMFPDGQMVVGVVPAVAGPLTIDDLIQTYGWRWVSSVYIAPVTPGSLARGIATFSGASNRVSIVFVPAFVSAPTAITIASSVDSGTGEPMLVSYDNMTASGFDLVAKDATYAGSVSWSAGL